MVLLLSVEKRVCGALFFTTLFLWGVGRFFRLFLLLRLAFFCVKLFANVNLLEGKTYVCSGVGP